MSDDLESGIQTELMPDGFRVEWIHWDSNFRKSGLDIGDYIVAVNGKPVDREKHYKAIGQYAENQTWQEIGVTAEQPMIIVTAVRDGKTFDVKGNLHVPYFYYDSQKRPALAPGGPARLINDGFDEPWSGWLEKAIKKYSYTLLRLWVQRSFNTRMELAEHLESKARIDFLTKEYPGPFADAMLHDWNRVAECMRGKKIELTDKDLEYRTLGERRKEIAKQEAEKAWTTLCKEATGQAFPVPDVAERANVVGKVVELPQVTYRDMVNDLGQAFMAIGSPSQGYYFLGMNSPELFRFYGVMTRYKGQINPTMPDKYRYLARVKDEMQMITVRGQAYTGLMLELIAVMSGDDECCIDLRPEPPKFAGEDQLSSFEPITLDASAGPEQVIEAMISAVKLGDDKTWQGLFADWQIVTGAGGREAIDFAYVPRPSVFADLWEQSRKNILGEVLDARVERVEQVKRVLERSSDLPEVEQVRVWVDHFGKFDSEVRAFKNLYVNREWLLQRLDGGPWKIVTLQHL
ncbi:MAG TPA: hypothetical protein VJP79_04185 [Nitrososphaera sp.]|nr:hypothetical protein [Nitrososphaera sp.]